MKLSQENKKAMKSLGLNPDSLYDIQKWLRDYFEIDIEILRSISKLKSYYYKITINNNLDKIETQEIIELRTYEKALENAISRALELKNNYIICSYFTLDKKPENLKDLVLNNFINNCMILIKDVKSDSLYTPNTYLWYKNLCMNLLDLRGNIREINEWIFTNIKGTVNSLLFEYFGRGKYEYLFGVGEFPDLYVTLYKKENSFIVAYEPRTRGNN